MAVEKTIRIEMVDGFEVGENVYEAFLHHF